MLVVRPDRNPLIGADAGDEMKHLVEDDPEVVPFGPDHAKRRRVRPPREREHLPALAAINTGLELKAPPQIPIEVPMGAANEKQRIGLEHILADRKFNHTATWCRWHVGLI